jgi:hypothetical protein
MSKRRRGQNLFSREAVLARLEAKSDVHHNIKNIANYESAKRLEMTQILNEKESIGEEVMVFILSSKLTMKGLLTLAMAIKHVPAAYSQTGHDAELDGYSNVRLYAIGMLMKKAGYMIEASHLETYVTLVETRCPSLLVSYKQNFSDTLWKATEEEAFNFNSMIAPPVDQCLRCKKPLTTNNKPTKATLYTLHGPIPLTKIRLRCRECAVQYGICTFRDKSGEHLYPRSHRHHLVEAGNVTYLEKALYEWIPSFGYESLIYYYIFLHTFVENYLIFFSHIVLWFSPFRVPPPTKLRSFFSDPSILYV